MKSDELLGRGRNVNYVEITTTIVDVESSYEGFTSHEVYPIYHHR